MEYKLEDLTPEDAEYIGGRINEIVPREVDREEEKFVLKIENEKRRNHWRMNSGSL